MNLGKEIAKRKLLVPGMAEKAEEAREVFLRELEQREIPDVAIFEGELGGISERRAYEVVQRSLGWGAKASAAVRIAGVGTDLVIDQRHFEQGLLALASAAGQYYLAIGLIGAGILTIWLMGSGLIMIILGVWMWNRASAKQREQLGGYQAEDSLELAHIVADCVLKALAAVGIEPGLIQEI